MSEQNYFDLLAQIKTPADVARLQPDDLPVLAAELRRRIINTVSNNGGHLASSLGVVELTLALLRVFNPKNDKIVWDVGHQAYAYKLLTGRADRFDSLRKFGGISGFPKMSESPYDHFGVGHASTSISAGLGMVAARELINKNNHVVSVIGDGSLTGGMVYEAMNHAGALGKPYIVILNDNQMAISKNVGALSYFFSRKSASRWVRRVEREISDFLQSVPGVGVEALGIAKRSKRSFKSLFTPGILFESLRFSYLGPVNGHDIGELERALNLAVSMDKPVLLHVLTQKGKGYSPAEEKPVKFHGIGRFNPSTGEVADKSAGDDSLSYTQVFSSTLCDLAAKNKKICAISAAMPEGTGLNSFADRFPQRFYDVGICEEHAVTFAAGLATQGLRPVVAIYSTFLQRAYDQVVHDVCLQNLPVVFALDRAGLVGEDGATHHGSFDIAYLRHIPNLAILAPRGRRTTQNALATALSMNTPVAIRYPRGECPYFKEQKHPCIVPPAKGETLRQGDGSLAVIALGGIVHNAWGAANELEKEGLKVTVYDPLWVKPLPEEDIIALASSHSRLLIVEEHVLMGGFGSAVLELLSDKGLLTKCTVYRHGLPDSFVEHGTAGELRAKYKLDQQGIVEIIQNIYQQVEYEA